MRAQHPQRQGGYRLQRIPETIFANMLPTFCMEYTTLSQTGYTKHEHAQILRNCKIDIIYHRQPRILIATIEQPRKPQYCTFRERIPRTDKGM